MKLIKKNMNLFFLMLLFSSTFMIMISSNWLNMWIYLEINLMSFIYLLIYSKNYLSLETSLIYFLIQTIASIILLFSMIFSFIYNYFLLFILISLLLKMGMAPFHYWMVMIINNLNWMMIYLLLTFQKISPLILLNQFYYSKFIIYFMIFSLIIGSLIGLNYSSLKKILVFSSINQMSWIIMSLNLLNNLFKLYMIMYMYMLYLIIYSFYYFNLKFIYQMINLKMNYKNMFIFVNLLSLGGLPPFIGFYPKLLIINMLNNKFLMMIMIMTALITLFYYMRIMISSMMLNSIKLKMNNYKYNTFKNNNLMWMSMLNNFMLIIMILIY